MEKETLELFEKLIKRKKEILLRHSDIVDEILLRHSDIVDEILSNNPNIKNLTYEEVVEEISKHPKMETEELKKIYRSDEKYARIREKIYLINANLVKKVLSDVTRGKIQNKKDEEDFIEAGNEGLLRAIDGFDITKNVKFSTYAYRGIRDYIYNEIDITKNRVSVSTKKLSMVRNVVNQMKEEGIKITIKEIQDKTGYKTYEVLLLLNLLGPQLSIDYKNDDGLSISNIIPSNENIEESYEKKEKKEKLIEFLKLILTEDELNIIELYYGLNDDEPLTKAEISRRLERKITPERVRQIIETAERKIKSSEGIDAFAVYMDKPDECMHRNSI